MMRCERQTSLHCTIPLHDPLQFGPALGNVRFGHTPFGYTAGQDDLGSLIDVDFSREECDRGMWSCGPPSLCQVVLDWNGF